VIFHSDCRGNLLTWSGNPDGSVVGVWKSVPWHLWYVGGSSALSLKRSLFMCQLVQLRKQRLNF